MERAELESWLQELGEKRFRGSQVFEWIHRHRCRSFEEMDSLPAALRARLKAHARIEPCRLRQRIDRETRQVYRFQSLDDGESWQAVRYGKHRPRLAIAVRGRLGRILSVAERVVQILTVQRELDSCGRRLEELHWRLDSLELWERQWKCLRIVHDPRGLGYAWRRSCLSIPAWSDGIEACVREGIPVKLAVRLVSPNASHRRRMQRLGRTAWIDPSPPGEVIEACARHVEAGGRLLIDYCLWPSINDDPELARELRMLLKGLPCRVRLREAEVAEGSASSRWHTSWQGKETGRLRRFRELLWQGGVDVIDRGPQRPQSTHHAKD